MMAAGQGHSGVVQLLIETGADPLVSAGRFTAADYARYGGHDELADRLVRVFPSA